MSVISLKELLEAGVHFGHQTKKWNPKMKKYIFGKRHGIYIMDLQKTLADFEKAYLYVKDAAAGGENILFVGTKKQAQEIVGEEAERCGICYVNKRWIGGTLTNFAVVKKSIKHLNDIIEKEENGTFSGIPKKELARIMKEKVRLEKGFGGLKSMTKLPDLLFIVDPVKEKTALTEAKKVGIFVIGVIDSNGDPELLDLCIAGNDDAIRAIKLLVSRMADAVLEGKETVLKKVKKAEEESPAAEPADSVKEEAQPKKKTTRKTQK